MRSSQFCLVCRPSENYKHIASVLRVIHSKLRGRTELQSDANRLMMQSQMRTWNCGKRTAMVWRR
jgi:hypothetical protein